MIAQGRRFLKVWDKYSAIAFALSVCFVYWAICILGSFGTDFTITVHPLHSSVDTRSILIIGASFLPALYCIVVYPECRASILKLKASWKVYVLAVATGLVLPFLSYPGTHYYAFPWGRAVALRLALVFSANLFLSPFWEEVIWRGCFLNKARSFSSVPNGILHMSFWCTVWHGGYIAFLYSSGIPIRVLSVLPFTYFFMGIIFGSVFEMAGGSLWPCVLLHVGFNAATVVYYTAYNRASELGSYLSELVFVAIAAGILFRLATKKRGATGPVDEAVELEGA